MKTLHVSDETSSIVSCSQEFKDVGFHVQAVVPVMSVKPTDTSPLASANISPLTNIPTSLNTREVLKIVAPFVQKIVSKFSSVLPQASN